MFDSDSVGGADERRNGLSNRTPVKVVDRSIGLILGRWSSVVGLPILPSRLPPVHSGLNQSVRFFSRHEDVVGIVQAERLQIDEQVMPVRQPYRNLRHVG